jgi:hypothetical protein
MLGSEGYSASQAEHERLSRRVIRCYAARCAARAEVRERKCHDDRERYVPGVFSAIADGTFAMGRKDSLWSLWLEWTGKYGRRLLARGSLADVERYALEVAVHGPPGGPDLRDQGPEWRDLGDDGTLHSLELGGEFRLMPLFDGGHILAFARNDAPVRILGIGEAEELKRTAVERLQKIHGDVLHVFLGDERIELRGVGAAGVLGYLEMPDGSTLLLGNLTGERFGLFRVRGDAGECLGVYDFEALWRGGLGQVLVWTRPDLGDEDGEDDRQDDSDEDGEDDLAERDALRQVEPDPPARVAKPRRPSSRPRPAGRQPPRVRVSPQRRQPPKAPTPRARLSAADLDLIDCHLTYIEPTSGKGKSAFPNLLKCLRILPALGLPNQLLRGCDLQRLFKVQCRIEFHCCSKTFGQALAAVAAKTPLLNPVGKLWSLPRVDAELLREIARLTPEEMKDAPMASAGATAGTPRRSPEPPTADPQPAAAPQPATAPATSARSTVAPRSSEPPAADSQPPAEPPASSASEAGQPSPPAGGPAPQAEPADRPHDTSPEPEGDQDDREALVDLPWLIAKGYRRYQPTRRGGRLRVTLASVPDSESASRWKEKKWREPP